MKRAILLLIVTSAVLEVAYAVEWPLSVSDDRRVLADRTKRPFFITADTAWKLLNGLTRPEMDRYLDHCRTHGINTVLFVFRPFQGPVNAYGEAPFVDGDISRPHEPYWKNVDTLVQKALDCDMLLMGVLLWHKDDQNAQDNNRRNPLKYTRTQCRALGRFLGQRYQAQRGFPNLVFVGGGDKHPGEDRQKYESLIAGVLEAYPKALLTYHAYHPKSSCDEWSHPGWLAVNGLYNYQPPHSLEWMYQEAWNNWREHRDKAPIMLYEGLYENESRKGYLGTPANIRKQHWWAVTSGCTAGHAYGNRDIWKMTDQWEAHLEDQARLDLQHIRTLMASIDWWTREPDTNGSVLVGGLGPAERRASACRTEKGDAVIVYSPNTEHPEIDMSRLNGPCEARWYDPRSGEFLEVMGPFNNQGIRTFPRPDDLDWVLFMTTQSHKASSRRG